MRKELKDKTKECEQLKGEITNLKLQLGDKDRAIEKQKADTEKFFQKFQESEKEKSQKAQMVASLMTDLETERKNKQDLNDKIKDLEKERSNFNYQASKDGSQLEKAQQAMNKLK